MEHKPGKLNSNTDGISRSPQILDSPTPKELRETAEFDAYICDLNLREELGEEHWNVNSLHVTEQDNEFNSVPVLALGQLDIPDWVQTQDQDEDLGFVKSWVKAQVKPSKEDFRMKNRSIHICISLSI